MKGGRGICLRRKCLASIHAFLPSMVSYITQLLRGISLLLMKVESCCSRSGMKCLGIYLAKFRYLRNYSSQVSIIPQLSNINNYEEKFSHQVFTLTASTLQHEFICDNKNLILILCLLHFISIIQFKTYYKIQELKMNHPSLQGQAHPKNRQNQYDDANQIWREVENRLSPSEPTQKQQPNLPGQQSSESEQVEEIKIKNGRISEHEDSRLSMNTRKKSMKFNICNQQCPLCLQSTIPEEFSNFTQCLHKFCIKCSLQLIKEEIEHSSRIQCPAKGCGAFLDAENALLAYLTADELEKLHKIEQFSSFNRNNISQNQIQLSVVERSMREDKEDNRTAGKTNQQIIIQMQASKVENSKSFQKSVSISLDSQDYVASSGIQIKENEMKNSGFRELNKARSPKQNQNSLSFPKMAFLFLCSEIWLNKWSRFLKMLPISLIIIILAILVLLTWSLWVAIYFVLVWGVFVPATWAIYQIWGCFQRSFKNTCLQKTLFTLCLIGFPLIFCFFYLLTLGVILFDGLFKADMHRVAEGKISLILSCRKVYLNKSMIEACDCRISEKCKECENKKSVCCLVL